MYYFFGSITDIQDEISNFSNVCRFYPEFQKFLQKTSILTRWICINKLVFCFKGNLIQLNI